MKMLDEDCESGLSSPAITQAPSWGTAYPLTLATYTQKWLFVKKKLRLLTGHRPIHNNLRYAHMPASMSLLIKQT